MATSYAPGDISVHFFLQLALIVFAGRGVGKLEQICLGQSQVVGEMNAGVIFRPSLFGLFLPGMQAAMFPRPARNGLYPGARLGVALCMFMVGTTFPLDLFRAKAKSALSILLASLVVLFASPP